MTEGIRNAVLAACMVSAGAGILSLLSYGRTLVRQMKFLLSMMLAISLAVPLLGMEFPEIPAFSDVESIHAQEILEQITQETAERLRGVLIEKLQEAGITCTEMEIDLHRDEENCIHISRVTAVCDDFAGSIRLLQELAGEGAEITVTEILGEAE